MQINLIKNTISFKSQPSIINELINITTDSRLDYHFNLLEEENINDKTQKYLLLYPLQGHVSHKLKREEPLFTDIILNKIKEGFDIKIFFCIEAESEEETAHELLSNYLKTINVNSKDVYLISGNSKIESINTFDTNTLEDFNPLIHRISNSMQFSGNFENFNLDKKYLFQFYNNHMKSHRVSLLCLLDSIGMLDSIDWSALRTGDLNYDSCKTAVMFDIFSEDEIESLIKNYTKILNGGTSKYSEFEDDSIRYEYGGINDNVAYAKNPYKHAYINIVSESQFVLKNTIHITEKSLIPFHFGQLPLFLATEGHIKKLKKLYGFDVFDDIIDHSYDSIIDPKERLYKVLDEIKRLNTKKDFIIDFYKNNLSRFENNKQIVKDLATIHPYDTIIKEFIKL